MKDLSKHEVIRRLSAMVEEAGNQKELARVLGVSQAFLSDVLAGNREPTERILAPMGLAREIRYVPRGSPAR